MQMASETTFSTLSLNDWMKGTKCTSWQTQSANDVNVTSNPINISYMAGSQRQPPFEVYYCPMPFQPRGYTRCCGDDVISNATNGSRCCEQPTGNTTTDKWPNWAFGLLAVVVCCVLAILAIASFNKCSKAFGKSSADSAPRPKIAINRKRHTIRPIDKRILLKTGNYTVEQSWDTITIRFYNDEFFKKFKDSLLHRYPCLSIWKDPRRKQEAELTESEGLIVAISMNDNVRMLRVSDVGALSWVLSDFQQVCKNIKMSVAAEPTHPIFNRSMSPRQPTTGEEYLDAGDYNVKFCRNEIEIKFTVLTLFDNFKTVLLNRYPEVPWSKYLQRDCSQIHLISGKTVTVHMWEDIRSVWLSGDGKQEWFGNEFCELHAEAKSLQCLPSSYTTKLLDNGGYEVEFQTADSMSRMRNQLDQLYPTIKWQKTGSREEAAIMLTTSVKNRNKSRQIIVQCGNATIKERKIWIMGDAIATKSLLNELHQLQQQCIDEDEGLKMRSS